MTAQKNGLVLTAGGARGAYQAGVLKRIGESPVFRGKPSPFQIISGASAGAINGGAIAAGAADFYDSTQKLAQVWSEIKVREVFRTDPASLGMGAARWMQDLSLGGIFGGGGAQSLLDATPLRSLLLRWLPLDKIQENIDHGHLYALAVSATSYFSGKSFTFIQGKTGHPLWSKSRRHALPVQLTVDHFCASAAIPIVFQPVFVKTVLGSFYFGDGGLRLVTPFSPAIRLGADRIFAIGIRSQLSAEARSKAELLEHGPTKPIMRKPPLAQVFGVALNAIFLDHLDSDLDHLKRMNDLLRFYASGANSEATVTASENGMKEPMRIIEPFAINPSVDLASIAEDLGGRMPRLVRYFMEGLGSSRAQSADLMSYLLFDSAYTRALIDVGYNDAKEHMDEIEHFLT